MPAVVTNNEDENRWEARLDCQLAGFAAYHRTHELVVFTHTEVEPAFEGRGVGGALAPWVGAMTASPLLALGDSDVIHLHPADEAGGSGPTT